MGFSLFRSVFILTIMLVLIAAPACAIKVTVGIRDGFGSASASGEYRLQNSAFLDSDIILGQGDVSRQSSAGGTGKNMVREEVSGSGSSVTNTLTSDGSFRSTTSDFASGAGAISSYQTSLDGLSGSIGTTSAGKENQMTVVGGFSGQGDMDVSISSLADQEALTTGSASALGTPCFSDEMVQGIRGQDMAVSVQGLYQDGGKGLGEFGVVAQNAKVDAGTKPQPGPVDYKLTGWMWRNTKPIFLSEDDIPTGYSDANLVKTQITAAQTTWDDVTPKLLFSGLSTATEPFNKDLSQWGTSDGKNVQLWSNGFSSGDSTLAMTVTWFTRAKTVLGADGRLYSEAVESDCWYNDNYAWRIDMNDGVTDSNSVDIRTIALHELGHTLGLDDLYKTTNSDQTMYGYNEGTSDWTLNSGDKSGLQKLYGN